MECSLNLSDGSSYKGNLIGAPGSATGELVFTTAIVGYTEAMTDPSYCGQVLVFGFPMIGNYGVPKMELAELVAGFESSKIHASAFVFQEVMDQSYHWRNPLSLDSWLKEQGVAGICGVDTRDLICRIRNKGRLYAKLECASPEHQRFLPDSGFFDPGTQQVIDKVSTSEVKTYGSGRFKIGVIDCGVKWNILRQLLDYDVQLTLFPWDHPLDGEMDGWLISNGPGDPEITGDLIERVKGLLNQEKPVLGICLGHQILALAAGATTLRMNYGHRSHNQPVQMLGSDRGYMTSQNHGFVVDNIPDAWEIWFRNVNDGTVEGIRHSSKPFWGVQFHPESAGGPRDTAWVMKQFIDRVSSNEK